MQKKRENKEGKSIPVFHLNLGCSIRCSCICINGTPKHLQQHFQLWKRQPLFLGSTAAPFTTQTAEKNADHVSPGSSAGCHPL